MYVSVSISPIFIIGKLGVSKLMWVWKIIWRSGSGEEGSSEFSLTKEKFSFFICVYNCLDFSLG